MKAQGDRLIGRVEVDETYWGAAEAGGRGRQLVDKRLVAVAVEQVGRRALGSRQQGTLIAEQALAHWLHGPARLPGLRWVSAALASSLGC